MGELRHNDRQRTVSDNPSVLRVTDPSLRPADVVQQQLEGLRNAIDHPDALALCYGFASPQNREATGPYNRFARLLRTPTYRSLLGHSGHIIGEPVESDGKATILVTVISSDETTHAFRFWLRKQAEPPYAACWMTDAVLPIQREGKLDFPVSEPAVSEPVSD